MHVILDSCTGEAGDVGLWVARFAEFWRGGRVNAGRFMDLMSPDIRLSAPGLRPTRGRAAGLEAFRRTFLVLPDLTAEVQRWSANGEAVFIEMTFRATIGGRRVEWRNVDRLLFRDGLAVERIAYYDATRVRRAFLRHSRGWLQLWRRWRGGP